MMANLSIDRSMFFGLIHDTEYLLQIYLQSNKELKDFRSILAHSKSVSQCYRNRSAVTFQMLIMGGIDATTVGYTLGALLHDVLEDGISPETDKPVTAELIKAELKLIFRDHIRELLAFDRSKLDVVIKTDPSDNYFQNFLFDKITDICIKTVTTLTRTGDETYKEYIERIASCSDNEIIRIKIIDIMDHFTNFETLKPSLMQRYLDALKVLAAVNQ